MNVTMLLDAYQVDQPHARQVADMSLALFDAVAERYDLLPAQRGLIEIGGLLHNVGLTTDPPEHHLVGRDIVLRQMIEGLRPRDQALIACMVAFHRKKVRPQLEPAFLALGKKGQREALQLAAILRVADGLDYSQSQSTRIVAVEPQAEGLLLRLTGPHARTDGERAVAKADLWAKIFDETVRATSESTHSEAAIEPGADFDAEPGETNAAVLTPWFVAPQAPLAELGRVLLRRHLRRLLASERDVLADKDIEAVHGLRVATRRLRATLKLLAPVYTGDDLRVFSKAIGRIAQAASAVRDRDVLLADLAARADTLTEEQRASLVALSTALEAERSDARGLLLDHLNSEAHDAFIKAFAAEMNDPRLWNNGPRVRDMGGSTIWSHYEQLRAHDRDGLPEAAVELHQMRIEGKRMRYVLELFADTIGPEIDEAVRPLMSFQDHLGILNDIDVARQILAPHARSPELAPATEAYLALRDEQGRQLLAELPERWAQLNSPAYARRLMELIVKL